MTKEVKAYTDDELRSAREYFADILTIEECAATKRLHDGHMHEVPVLVELFRKASHTLSNKWNAPLLAKLPVKAWEIGPAGLRRIKPHDFASMRYLSPRLSAEEMEIAEKWMAEREKLMKGLHEPGGPYSTMTEWKSPGQFKAESVNRLPFNGDIAFMETVDWLDNHLGREMKRLTRSRHSTLGLSISEALPLSEDKRCSLEALELTKQQVEVWCKDASLAGAAPDSLRTVIAANLAVNRAMWETCGKDARGEEATIVAQEFLNHLNGCGFDEVPPEVPTRQVKWTGLAELLSNWFGPKGLLRQRDNFFVRILSPAQIALAVELSESVQARYMRGRGFGMQPGEGELAHGSPENLFIFAMATVSVFYVKGQWGEISDIHPVQVPKEFRNQESRSSSRYPASSPLKVDSVESGGQMLRIHAEELVEQVYGQMFFANTDWNLRAQQVPQHAEKQAVQRACHEQLLEFAVKVRSSQELLNLFTQVSAYADREIASGRLVLM